MQDSAVAKGYKGYILQKRDAGLYDLVSPTGVNLAAFIYTLDDSMPHIQSSVPELDCGEDHATGEHAIKYIVKRYERLTTTRLERFRKKVSGFFSHSMWGAIASIAAIIAAVASIMTYFKL